MLERFKHLKAYIKTSFLIGLLSLHHCSISMANHNVLNIYSWAGQLPSSIVQQFQQETGIKVNLTAYDSNEMLYAKMKARKTTSYDIISPSNYFLTKMQQEQLLLKLDYTLLPNAKYLDIDFLRHIHYQLTDYAIPLQWGSTGIFVNSDYYTTDSITTWTDFWRLGNQKQLLLLDDMREVFSMALMSLGYDPNDEDPRHLQQAYAHLRSLIPKIKLFNNSGLIALMVDEDLNIGMAWNGEILRAQQENHAIHYYYPQDGFMIWLDNLAIPATAPHPKAAHKFINFMLRPDIAAQLILYGKYPVLNNHVKPLLPSSLSEHPYLFPNENDLSRAHLQHHISPNALKLIEKYWELLKIS